MNLKGKIYYSSFGALVAIFIFLSYQVIDKSILYYKICNTSKIVPERVVSFSASNKDTPVAEKREKKKIVSPLSGYSQKQVISWHSKRYGVSATPKPFLIVSYNGKMLKRSELKETIRAVFQRLPHIKTSNHLVELLIETSEVETLRGIERINTVSSATGLFQILPRTAKDTISWLRKYHKDVYTSLMGMYNKRLSLKDNLYYNVPFSIGLSVTYYWRMTPNLWDKITTHEKRAELWSNVYNTPLDTQGTAKFYMKQVKKVKNKNV